MNARCLKQSAICTAIMVIAPSSVSSQSLILGPDQFEEDKSGHGAVLCAWGLYLDIQALTSLCKYERNASDSAMDRAILKIYKFIIANSSLHPTQEMLEGFKQKQTNHIRKKIDKDGVQKTCENPDIEIFRRLPPEQIDTSVENLLDQPREPVMNPCL